MKKLHTLSNSELISNLLSLTAEERRLTSEVLAHLQEIENRKLYLDEGYPSLFEYCVKALHYSEASAFRRISAMRLLKQIPEAEMMLNNGALNLTQLTQAREFFKEEEKLGNVFDNEQKRKVLTELQSKSTREAKKFLADISCVKVEEKTEIKLWVNQVFLEKLTCFKSLNSHVQLNPSHEEVFEYLLDFALKQKDPIREKKPKSIAAKSRLTTRPNIHNQSIGHPSPSAPEVKPSTRPETATVKTSRFIPAELKSAIWSRDQSCCSFQNSPTGKTCGSTFQLQIDHILPIAKGGESVLENLRLVCRNHNLHFARMHFGQAKMKKYENNWH
jgi:5-methylcytosine-specific restriction endonuclease McrA